MSWKTLVAIGFAAMLASSARAEDRHLKKNEVPKKVLASVAAKYPKADVTDFVMQFADGKSVYVVRLKTGDRKVQLVLSADGKLLAEELPIPEKQAPAAVRASLSTSKYSSAKVLSVEKRSDLEKPGADTYAFVVDEEGEQHELLFSPRGDLRKDTPQQSSRR